MFQWFSNRKGNYQEVSDQSPMPVEAYFTPLNAHNGLTVAAATTVNPPAGATKVLVQAVGNNIRFTIDGSTPTANFGFQLRAGDPPIAINLGASTVLNFIQEAVGATLQLQWGK